MKESLRSSKTSTEGTLYCCATPIGNLDDCSHRLLDILRSVDIIAAEDTRQTQKLLTHFDIHTKLIRVDQHTEKQKAVQLISELQSGKSVALVSDAGTPNICDPGAILVHAIHNKNITICPVPGPSAISALLSVSGLNCNEFYFMGFFPRKPSALINKLQDNAGIPACFFESGKRILKTLRWLQENVSIHQICVGKELTKVHETIWFDLEEVIGCLAEDERRQKGEWAVVIQLETSRFEPDLNWVSILKQKGLTLKQVVEVGNVFSAGRKNEIYKQFHES